MAKISWDAFVTKYPGAGHLVSTGTQPKLFKKPSGISPNNQRQWPTISALVKELLGPSVGGDWAHMSQPVPGWTLKNGKRVKVAAATLHLFTFAESRDALVAARLLRAASTTPTKSPPAGFSSLIQGSELDMQEYARLVKILGY